MQWGNDGDGTRLQTTRENISQHMQNMPLPWFSGTLLDSITAARKLGIGYIWIDAISIIQGDEEDFARDSVLMHKVYTHAILKLSICTSESSRELADLA